MKFTKSAARLTWLSLLAAALVGCSSAPPQPLPPAVVPPPAIPRLSPELSKEPLPSGSYWERVTRWRKDWAETLKTLPPK
jgi:hypothetical protein